MHAISVTNDLAVRRTANWMPRNYETRNNSGGPNDEVVTSFYRGKSRLYGDWSFFFFSAGKHAFSFIESCNENLSFNFENFYIY